MGVSCDHYSAATAAWFSSASNSLDANSRPRCRSFLLGEMSIAALRSRRRSSRRDSRRLRVGVFHTLHDNQLRAAFASARHVNELPVGVEGERMSLDLGL